MNLIVGNGLRYGAWLPVNATELKNKTKMSDTKETIETTSHASISGVSESFRKEIRDVMEHHLEQEKKNAGLNNYQNAIYHSTMASAMQEVLLRISNYSR